MTVYVIVVPPNSVILQLQCPDSSFVVCVVVCTVFILSKKMLVMYCGETKLIDQLIYVASK